MVRIIINGKAQELPAVMTVAGLITHLQLDNRQVAIERNREIVPKSTHAQVMVADGDEIEIVRFIGGG